MLQVAVSAYSRGLWGGWYGLCIPYISRDFTMYETKRKRDGFTILRNEAVEA